MLSCEHLSSLFFYNGFTSLTLGWLSTPILIEKCTQGKSSGAFLVFQGAFLKAGCIFPRVGCISEKQGAFWEDKVHCYYLFLKESQIESHL